MLIELKATGALGAGSESYLFDMDDVQMIRSINYTSYKQHSICVHGQWISNVTDVDIQSIRGYMKGKERDFKINGILDDK